MDPFEGQLRVEPGRRGFWEPGRPSAHVGPRPCRLRPRRGLRPVQRGRTFLAEGVCRSLTGLLPFSRHLWRKLSVWLLTYTGPHLPSGTNPFSSRPGGQCPGCSEAWAGLAPAGSWVCWCFWNRRPSRRGQARAPCGQQPSAGCQPCPSGRVAGGHSHSLSRLVSVVSEEGPFFSAAVPLNGRGGPGVWSSSCWFVQAVSPLEPAQHQVPWPLGRAVCAGPPPPPWTCAL